MTGALELSVDGLAAPPSLLGAINTIGARILNNSVDVLVKHIVGELAKPMWPQRCGHSSADAFAKLRKAVCSMYFCHFCVALQHLDGD
jgi:late competence protein required for DNA uptake (superfamily II DNA/RNA helicase)